MLRQPPIVAAARLDIEAADREYPELYARFAELIARASSEADPAPLRLVADALLVGKVRRVAAFVE